MNISDTIHIIMTRRSIRSFTEQEVNDEQIKTILKVAMNAPSAGNAQPWEFIVIKNKNSMKKIAEINEYASFAPSSSVGILACGNLNLEKFKGYWVQDVSASIENMLIAIHAMGLGAVWTGIYPMNDRVSAFSTLFDLPNYIIPLGLILIGYAKNTPKPVERFDEKRIHWEKW